MSRLSKKIIADAGLDVGEEKLPRHFYIRLAHFVRTYGEQAVEDSWDAYMRGGSHNKHPLKWITKGAFMSYLRRAEDEKYRSGEVPARDRDKLSGNNPRNISDSIRAVL
ncbi:MAG: hypothetical protein ABWK00_06195 [Desulfurococcaceae archaeon]